jgi:hypothetical protein
MHAPASSVPPKASSPPHPSVASLLLAAEWLTVAGAGPPTAARWPQLTGVGEARRKEHGLPRPRAPPTAARCQQLAGVGEAGRKEHNLPRPGAPPSPSARAGAATASDANCNARL